MIRHLTNDTFQKEALESTKPVVIDAYALWCGPCQLMGPLFEEVAQAQSDKYTFFKLNVDEEHELAARLSISSIPTLIFINKGTVLDTHSGSMSKTDLEDTLIRVFKGI